MFFELYDIDTGRLLETTTARNPSLAKDCFSCMRYGKFTMIWTDDQSGMIIERTVSL